MSPGQRHYSRNRAAYGAIWRDLSKERRDTNREAKACINETKQGTHGLATHGVLCRRCRAVHRYGAEVVRERGIDALIPPNPDVVADQHDARSAA